MRTTGYCKNAAVKNCFLVFLFCMTLLLAACASQGKIKDVAGEIKAIEVNYDYKFDESVFRFRSRDYVKDARTALAIGDAVIKEFVGEAKFEKLIDFIVAYDSEQGIWLIERNLGGNSVGGGFACAIKKDTGEILSFYGEE